MLKDVKAEGTVLRGSRRELKRKERDEGERYVVSRWIPIIQDIMEVYTIPPFPTRLKILSWCIYLVCSLP